MANMKIENYEGTADTFTFPYNPKSFDQSGVTNIVVDEVDYQSNHIFTSGAGIKPKSIVLSGHFSGTTKDSDFRNLNKHFLFESNKLKKLYWADDRFTLGFGVDCKGINTGGRVNFLDYVAGFKQVFPIYFGTTQHTTATNAGDVATPVEEITANYTSGNVTLSDNRGHSFSIDSSKLTNVTQIRYSMVKMSNSGSGVFITEYGFLEVFRLGVWEELKQIVSTGNYGVLEIDAGSDYTDITTTNLSSVVIKYRDAFTA